MTQLLAFAVLLLGLSNWALWDRYYEIHRELFDLKHPLLDDSDGVIAAYLLGKSEDDPQM